MEGGEGRQGVDGTEGEWKRARGRGSRWRVCAGGHSISGQTKTKQTRAPTASIARARHTSHDRPARECEKIHKNEGEQDHQQDEHRHAVRLGQCCLRWSLSLSHPSSSSPSARRSSALLSRSRFTPLPPRAPLPEAGPPLEARASLGGEDGRCWCALLAREEDGRECGAAVGRPGAGLTRLPSVEGGAAEDERGSGWSTDSAASARAVGRRARPLVRALIRVWLSSGRVVVGAWVRAVERARRKESGARGRLG